MSNYALVVDPDPSRARVYDHLLAPQYLSTVAVTNGEAALGVVSKQGKPALVITELALPKMDGFTLLERLHDRLVDCPMLAISKFRELRNTAVQKRKELGLTAVLASQMSLPALERAIRAALAHKEVKSVEPTTLKPDAARLAAIQATGLVDEQKPDESLQQLCEEVARALHVETALVSFVLEDRQWFKAYAGLGGELLANRGTPIEQSFCRHAVDAKAPLVVPDARINPYFKSNALVTSGQVRGYAGVPLETTDGTVLGTLCVLDSKPLALDEADLEKLKRVARRIAGELELRQAAPQALPALWLADDKAFRAVLDGMLVGVLLHDEQRRVVFANRALATLSGLPQASFAGMSHVDWLEHVVTLVHDPAEFMAKIKVLPDGPFAATESFSVDLPRPRIIHWTAKPIRTGSGVVQLELFQEWTAPIDVVLEGELVDAEEAGPVAQA